MALLTTRIHPLVLTRLFIGSCSYCIVLQLLPTIHRYILDGDSTRSDYLMSFISTIEVRVKLISVPVTLCVLMPHNSLLYRTFNL